jgi:RND family efflux transporter MFP subunit
MKPTIAILIVTLVFIGCQPPAPEGDVATLQLKRSALKTTHDSLSKAIAEIDAHIASMDTTKKAPLVTTYQVSNSSFDHFFWIQGSIASDYNTMVYPEINGSVKRILVEEGQKVSKNQALMELDTEIIKKNIREVETNYALAVEMYTRQKNLWDQKIGSEVQYLEAKTRKEALENTLATLSEQLDMGTVRAPFAGMVDEITLNMGEMANPMMPIARVLNIDKVYIEADVSEFYFGKIDEGDYVQVEVADVDTIEAEVSRIGKFINPENRTFNLRVDLNNVEYGLIPNLVATVKVNDFHQDTAVCLPSSMILEDTRGDEFVYVVDESGSIPKVNKTIIKSGRTYEGVTMIESGLSGTETIVDKGSRKVTDGSPVRVKNQQSASVASN